MESVRHWKRALVVATPLRLVTATIDPLWHERTGVGREHGFPPISTASRGPPSFVLITRTCGIGSHARRNNPMVPNGFEHHRRAVAVLVERVADGEISLARLWNELTTGQTRIVDSFIDEKRCYLLFGQPPSTKNCGLSERRRAILERLLCGQSIKASALDLSLSQSTVCQEAKAALHQFGLECTPCRANPLLAMLARAAVDGQRTHRVRVACFVDSARRFRVVSVARPDGRLAPILPPAEFAVVRGLLEGRNYLQIAATRGTSTRTVANQVAAAFRRLGVSGRGSLLDHVVSASQVT